ncbi:hypothetical protein [Ekhidna sp.]|uniref:hypothetical protein n=1 Tax=Ekhidna sp. TaxID=2608089 RepID=UPI003298B40E
MNRFLFILSIIIILVSGRLMQVYKIPGYGFIILGLGTILVSLRRSYLGLRPWWGAPFKDIPKYFKKP